jgi:hypothetical protein
MFLEKSDIANYGRILPSTVNFRNKNPELVYIERVNKCASDFLKKFYKSNVYFKYGFR